MVLPPVFFFVILRDLLTQVDTRIVILCQLELDIFVQLQLRISILRSYPL